MKLNIGSKESGFSLETEGSQEIILTGVVAVGALAGSVYIANKTLKVIETVAKRDDLPKIFQGVMDNVLIPLKKGQRNLKRVN